MPTFELFFITRRLTKTGLVSCLRRTAEVILNSNGVLRKIENLGTRQLPAKHRTPIAGTKRYTSGNYFLYHFDAPIPKLEHIVDACKLDTDIFRVGLSPKKTKLPEDYVCTLEEEFRPPAYRDSVRALIEAGGKRFDKKEEAFVGQEFDQ